MSHVNDHDDAHVILQAAQDTPVPDPVTPEPFQTMAERLAMSPRVRSSLNPGLR